MNRTLKTILLISSLIIVFVLIIPPFRNNFYSYIRLFFEPIMPSVAESIATKQEEDEKYQRYLRNNNQQNTIKNSQEYIAQENKNLQKLLKENENLRKLLLLQKKQYRMTFAEVVLKSSKKYYSSFTINQGKNSALNVGDIVLSGGNVVGRISHVGINDSVVESICNENFNLACRIKSLQEKGVFYASFNSQDNSYTFYMDHIEKSLKFEVGSVIETTNVSHNIPSSLPIGEVISYKLNMNDKEQIAFIKPFVDLNKVNFVSVLSLK